MTRSFFKLLAIPFLLLTSLSMLLPFSCSRGKKPPPKHFCRILKERIKSNDLLGREENVQAFLAELLFTLFEEEGVEVILFDAQNEGEAQLKEGNADALLTHRLTESLKHSQYLPSDCLLYTGLVLVVGIDSPLISFSSAGSYKIAVQETAPVGFPLNHYPHLVTVPYYNMNSALDDLLRFKVDGVVMPLLRAYGNSQGFYQGKIRINPLLLNEQGFRLLFTTENRELMALFNEGLLKMKKSGAYDRLIRKWDLCRADPLM